MIDTVRTLQKLQDLEITYREAVIMHGGQNANSDSLRASIDELRGLINADCLARYDRLSKHGLAVVQVVNNQCMGCNLSIPQGDMNRMRSSRSEPICPNCGVYLAL